MRRNFFVCIFLLCIMSFPKLTVAETRTTFTVISIPVVKAYQENVTLGMVKISEDSAGTLINGRHFSISLPSEITFSQNTVIQATYFDESNLQDYTYPSDVIQTELFDDGSSMKIELNGLNYNFINNIWINTVADIGCYSGDITLIIDGRSSGVSNASLTIGRSVIENLPGIPEYLVNIVPDDIYTIGETNDGIKTMTVKNGVSGFKYFTVSIQSVNEHVGDEVAVFALWREGQLNAINATKADFDNGINTAKAGFNVSSGDMIKVYIVDDLTNSQQNNPVILQ